MSFYKCRVCGHKFEADDDSSKELKCSICGGDVDIIAEQHNEQVNQIANEDKTDNALAYPSEYFITDPDVRYMDEIHEMSVSGKTIMDAMSIEYVKPSWDDILFLGGQLNPMPLMGSEEVNTETIIGKNARKPLVIQSPVYITHMSFGALSKEAKIALAKGSASVKTAIGSGEGGIVPEELDNSYKYILEYVPHKYGASKENLKIVDAIEIKIGQGTKPGIGGFLPAVKVTEDIAKVRDVKVGENVEAPSKFPDINSKEDLKDKVSTLRKESDGRPIGIKIAAGRIENALEVCVFAEPDFITIDGRGGASAASPILLRNATSLPTIYALYRARKYLDEVKSDISLLITGGLRVSSDFAKALAMGADAIAIGTAALMSMGCQQYRLCTTGKCPVGITTQDPDLRARFDIDKSSKRLTNFLNVTLDELKGYARICGKHDVHDLSVDDLSTASREISNYTSIQHG